MRGRHTALTILALGAGIAGGVYVERFYLTETAGGGAPGSDILYWVAPMDPNFRRDGPGKSPMGMDLIPVRAGDAPAGDPAEVMLSPGEINAIGVRTALAQVSEQQWGAERASWRWSVEESVPPTALDRKGGDDRNLSLYFVFLPRDVTQDYKDSNIRRLLDAEEARVLMYVWGGETARGNVLPSPYLGSRGKTIVLRGAGTGSFNEAVDLKADLRRAFGADGDGMLVGLAISADSDDTDSRITAGIAGLALE